MSQPLVTVVTVVWNAYTCGRAELLKQSLASVASQNYPHIEHLVIDGGSTDGTLDILRPYEAKGAIKLVSEPDRGIYDAMNKGIARAQGKYTAFLNSDDYWHDEQGISTSVELLEKTGAAFSYAPSIWLGENDCYLATNIPQIGVFYAMMPFCHQTMFTRTDKLRDYGGFDNKTFRSVADYDLICRMLMAGERPVYNPHLFTTFRMGGFNNANEEQNRLRESENSLMRKRLFGHLMGAESAANLSTQKPLSTSFSKALEMLVHPSVAVQMERSIDHISLTTDHFGLIANIMTEEKLQGIPPEEIPNAASQEIKPNEPGPEIRTIMLFGVLPILTAKSTPRRDTWNLFGILPLLKVRKANSRKSYLLLGFLPLIIVRRARK